MVSKAKSDPERSRISRSQRSSRKEIKFKSGNPKQPSRKKVSQDSVPNRHTSSEVRTSYLLEAFSSSDEGGWIFDSAATTHFCRDKDLFSKFEQPNASWSSGQYNYPNKSRFQKRAERLLDRKIKCIRTDNGLEFINEQFHNFCDELGIKHERTNIYTPQQNGVSERFNYTAVDGMSVLLKDSGLGQGFWSEALLHFVYTWNRIWHSNQCKTPFELYGGKQPSIKHLKPFGCKAFVHIPKQLRKKLDTRSKSGILVGYALQTKGYRIWLPEARKLIETNVRFNESTPVNLDSNNHKFERVEAVLDPDYVKNKIPLRTASYNDNNEIVLHEIDRESKSSDESDSESKSFSEKVVNWIRKPVPRADGKRTDIYYYEEGKKQRLRSLKEENPGITHWNGLLKLLGYISYTKDLRLNLSNIQDTSLTAYSDADFANNRDDRISMNGQIVFIDQVPVIWRSFKQKSPSGAHLL
ncbi:Retrovirus-related Pol polyprotein from transposon TNT 1-94 [Araneus ventricosus]|uniref:Retrovirus-related Pol polyprotein from transposon TNT 1-94 n=1 Tax=Araneus ventricosus TaxID=182803 RepID=A0A4Y2H555_ARAVE|nr:Retrovirus-related Pol polyprotein from transposon TNT 1-94 [Araneus ventricosus]